MLPRSSDEVIAIAATVPTALREPVQVASFAPSALPHAADDLMTRVTALYDADPQLHPAWQAALETKGLAADAAAPQAPASLGRLTAGFLTKPNGLRIAMLETLGWDTHDAQKGRLANQLKNLDAMVAGAAAESLALDPERVGRGLFAQATSDRPMTGLIKV